MYENYGYARCMKTMGMPNVDIQAVDMQSVAMHAMLKFKCSATIFETMHRCSRFHSDTSTHFFFFFTSRRRIHWPVYIQRHVGQTHARDSAENTRENVTGVCKKKKVEDQFC